MKALDGWEQKEVGYFRGMISGENLVLLPLLYEGSRGSPMSPSGGFIFFWGGGERLKAPFHTSLLRNAVFVDSFSLDYGRGNSKN